MIISINNAVEATNIFIAIFIAVIVLSLRQRRAGEVFSVSVTHELKGLAILAIVFSHIGYFLVDDHRFLFPLSIMAGVGVNLFLFLSGFGLAVSALKKKYSIGQFYQRRLPKLFVPFWIALVSFFVLDFIGLDLTYSRAYVMQSFLGFFPRADVTLDVNSPLWYFTFVLFYYIIFPFIFFRKHPWLSALAVFIISDSLVSLDPPLLSDVMRLYQVHIMAFPLGMFTGSMLFSPNKIRDYIFSRYKQIAALFLQTNLVVKIRHHRLQNDWHQRLADTTRLLAEFSVLLAMLAAVFFTAYHSGVGSTPEIEQLLSLVTMAALLIVFLIKRVDINLFYFFGIYSYEIYLLHWPILYRYDILLKYLPAWLAVSLYLIVFMVLGWLLKKTSRVVFRRLRF